VANLLVLVEMTERGPLPGSLEALGQARRIGSALGATVYALAPCAESPGYGDDDLIAVLSRHGADKILLSTDPSYAPPVRFGTQGPFVLQACANLPPSLLLAASSAGARDLLPRVAARLGAAFLADGWVDVAGDRLALFEGSGAGAHRLDDDELEFPVVALLPPGRYATAAGDDEAEVEVLAPVAASGGFAPIDAQPACAGSVVGEGAGAQALAAALDGGTNAPPSSLVIDLQPSQLEVRVAGGQRYLLEGASEPAAQVLATAITTAASEVPAHVEKPGDGDSSEKSA
jgi:hypothetical protein